MTDDRDIAPRGDVTSRPLHIAVIGYGSGLHVRNRILPFLRRGHRVTILVHEPPQDVPDGVEVVNVAPSGREFLRLVAIWHNYVKALRRGGFDAVHVHFAMALEAWAAAYAAPCPLVVTAMGGDVLFDEQGTPSPTARWATTELLRAADVISCVSDFMIDRVVALGDFRAKTIRTIWMPDPAVFRRVDASALRRALGLADDEPVVFSPKLLKPFYNIHVLVEAMARVCARLPKARLILCELYADPEYRAGLARQIEECGLAGRVVFVGAIEHGRMAEFYSLADVVVGLPPSDGLPMTLMEAMACGTANVYSALPNIGEVARDGVNALLVPIDAAAVAAAIARVLSDASLRETLVRNGLETVAALPGADDDVKAIEGRVLALLDRPRRVPRDRRFLLRQAIHNWHLEHSFGGYRYTSQPPVGLDDFERFQPLWHVDLFLRFVRKPPRRWLDRLVIWPLGDLAAAWRRWRTTT